MRYEARHASPAPKIFISGYANPSFEILPVRLSRKAISNINTPVKPI